MSDEVLERFGRDVFAERFPERGQQHDGRLVDCPEPAAAAGGGGCDVREDLLELVDVLAVLHEGCLRVAGHERSLLSSAGASARRSAVVK